MVASAQAAIVYVDKNSVGSVHDGKSWTTAILTVASGYAAGRAGDEVWVGQGEYKERVILRSGVGLFGGFTGTETDRTQRSPAPGSLTILNGTLGGTVVTAPIGVQPDTAFDGFHVINGNAHDGGGMVCDGSYPQIVNCWFSNNTADTGGAIFCTNNAGPGIGGNLFTNNTAKNGGGAIHIQGCSPGLSGNTFASNSTTSADQKQGFGGAIWIDKHASPFIVVNIFRGNHANHGGALSENVGFDTVANNLFDSNTAVYSGGAIEYEASQVYIEGNTIVGNTAPQGGALSQINASPVFASSVLNNVAAFNSSGIFDDATGGSIGAYANNDVFGNGAADWTNIVDQAGLNGNIHSDPLFANAPNGDYHLSAGSPCIDAGDKFSEAWGTDLDGNPRVRGAQADIGAYEALVPVYTLDDVAQALRVSAGIAVATHEDMRRLDMYDGAGSFQLLTVQDAVAIARKAAGTDANP